MSVKTRFNFLTPLPGQTTHNLSLSPFFKKDPIQNLMGEFSQNTLDAFRAMLAKFGGVAHLRFTLKLVPRSQLVDVDFEAAETHAQCCEGFRPNFEPLDMVPVLLIEDESGGLDGDVTATNNDEGTPLGRYLFEIGSGIHGKAGRAGGRFGVGSTTGSLLSALRTMYMHSTRMNGSRIASARFAQPAHIVDGVKYFGDARLGRFVDDVWDGIPKDAEADRVHAAFGMMRPLTTPGLSCAIPYYQEGVNFLTILKAALIVQFYQIAMGLIKITIDDQINGGLIMLDKETLPVFLKSQEYTEILGASAKAERSALDRAHSAYLFVSALGELTASAVIPNGERIAVEPQARKQFSGGKPIRVDTLQRAEHLRNYAVEGKFTNIIGKLPAGEQGFHLRVRDGIVAMSKPVSRGIASITMSSDDDIASVVGDGENPAHTEWTFQQAKDRGWVKQTRAVFSAFNGNAAEIYAALSGHEEESDRFSLATWLPMPGKQSYSSGNSGPPGNSEVEGETFDSDGMTTDSIQVTCDPRTSSLIITLSQMSKDRIAERGPMALSLVAEYHKSFKNSGDLQKANGFFSVQRGASRHYVDITPFGQKLTVPSAQADLKIALKVDLVRDVKISAELLADASDSDDLEDAA